jgi:collagen triple helix repeat protein
MRRSVWTTAVGGALGLVLVTAAARASIPDANGVIHTCVSQAKGTWRPIDFPAETCRSGESMLDFNQQGPKGDPGVNGVDGINGIDGRNGINGVNGVDGKDGQDGVSGYEIVTSTVTLDPATGRFLTALCPQGKRVMSGGWELVTPAAFGTYFVNGGIPETIVGGPFDGRSAWRFTGVNAGTVPLTFTVAGVCVIAN